MRIAAHNGARIWGGAERATARLLAGLAGRGHEVTLFCNDPRVAERAAALGVPTRILPLGGDVALPHALRFAAALRELRPDVLLVGTYKKLMLAALAGRLARVPRLVARIGLETDTPRTAKYRWVLGRWVDAVVVNASRIRPAFVALPGWTEARVPVIPNGVVPPLVRLAAGEVRRSLGIPDGARVIGTVARLDVQKRLDRLLRAAAALPADVHVLVAGEGDQRPALETLAAELAIAARVHLPGHREEVGDLLAALDLLVVTSDREGLSNSMLEGMSLGVPVVSTPVSGADDALDPGPDGAAPGVLLCTFEEDELVGTIGALLADPARLAAHGAAARAVAAERFGWERMLDRWEAALAPGARARP